MKCKSYIILLILCATVNYTIAQRQTKSPFSRFGYGELYTLSNAYNQALGGIGVGIQNSTQINFLNPAHQASIKKETFLCNIGLGGNFRKLQEENTSSNVSNVGLESMSIAFPIIANRWGCAVGILPFNSIGYEMNYSDSVTNYSYIGDGGINQVVLSTGVQIIKGLSLGVSAAYLFGTTNYISENTFESTVAFSSKKEQEFKTLGFLWNAGIQYSWQINEVKSLTFGATVRTPQQLTYRSNESFESFIMNSSTEVTKDTVYQRTHKSSTDIPLEIGFGASYKDNDKLLVGIDAGFQNWTDISCYGTTTSNLTQTKYIKCGAEFIPDYKSTKWYKRLPLRCGLYYSTLPIMYQYAGETQQIQDKGFTIGTRIKAKQSLNSMALALDMGQRGNSNLAKSLHETYLLFKLNVTIQEVWFTKRKIN